MAEGRATAVHPLVLDESDGMPSAECTSGYGPAGLRTQSGLLLFSTTRHLVAVDPKNFTASAPPPNVLIDSIVADGKPMRSSARELSFSPGLRELSIEYTAFNFAKPDRIRFRYRLKGLQEEWTRVGERRVARFALLPPGHYTFEVSAANEDGRWNETAASLTFAVQPFFWQTAWFRLAVVLLLMTISGGVVAWWSRIHIRQARAREKLARAEAEAQQRRHEVAHLMRVASLGELSSALAHELSQPLTAILSNAQAAQRFLAQEKPDQAEVDEILRDIVADDQRASAVIQRLRSLLKKGEFEPQALEVNELIHEVIKLMQSDLTAHEVTVVTELGAGLPRVRADRVQLQQILINLIQNASSAMSETAPPARTLKLRSDRGDDGLIKICVDDAGRGIPNRRRGEGVRTVFHHEVCGIGLGFVGQPIHCASPRRTPVGGTARGRRRHILFHHSRNGNEIRAHGFFGGR